MKRLLLINILLLILMSSLCQGVIRVEVTKFNEEGDSLNVEYKALISGNAILPHQSLRLLPLIQAGDSVFPLPDILIIGRNKEKVLSRYQKEILRKAISIKNKNDTTLLFNIKTPYPLWMDSASLVFRQEITDYRKQKSHISYKLKDQVVLSSREPYQVKPTVSFITPKKEDKQRNRQGKAYLDFQIGKSVIIPTYRRNPVELAKIDEAIREVLNNPDAKIQGLFIEGYASPDGNYQTNERLSRERALALENYIKNKFGSNLLFIKTSSIAEDWEGLINLISVSHLNGKEKILEIIGTEDNIEKRKTTLIKYDRGAPYKIISEEMLPDLRRVEYQIDYSVKDYSIQETMDVLNKRPEDLSHLELYNLSLTYGLGHHEHKKIILETIPHFYKNDNIANNNAAALMIQEGELITAKRYLEKAGTNPAVLNNLGVIYLSENNLEKAEELFTQAKKAGNEESANNLKELDMKRQDTKKMERYKNRK